MQFYNRHLHIGNGRIQNIWLEPSSALLLGCVASFPGSPCTQIMGLFRTASDRKLGRAWERGYVQYPDNYQAHVHWKVGIEYLQSRIYILVLDIDAHSMCLQSFISSL